MTCTLYNLLHFRKKNSFITYTPFKFNNNKTNVYTIFIRLNLNPLNYYFILFSNQCNIIWLYNYILKHF